MIEPRRNIINLKRCPKCNGNDFDLRYEAVFDQIHVECKTCHYEFNCSCADSNNDEPGG